MTLTQSLIITAQVLWKITVAFGPFVVVGLGAYAALTWRPRR